MHTQLYATYLLPPPRRRGGLVLYVDFDGVVQPESVYFYPRRGPILVRAPRHELFEHVGLLEQELAPYPAVRIVLSTSWVRRYRGSISKVARHLTPALQKRVIGATFHSKMNESEFAAVPRGVQIWADVVRRKPLDWLALDDDAEQWPTWCRDKFVQTDEILGISAPGALKGFRAKLATMVHE